MSDQQASGLANPGCLLRQGGVIERLRPVVPTGGPADLGDPERLARVAVRVHHPARSPDDVEDLVRPGGIRVDPDCIE